MCLGECELAKDKTELNLCSSLLYAWALSVTSRLPRI